MSVFLSILAGKESQRTVIASIFAVLRQTSSTHRDTLRGARVLANTVFLGIVIVGALFVTGGCQTDDGRTNILALSRDVARINVLRCDTSCEGQGGENKHGRTHCYSWRAGNPGMGYGVMKSLSMPMPSYKLCQEEIGI